MINWNHWLPGLGHDEPEEDDAVTKTLKALGQGVSDAGSAISSGINSAATAVSDAYAVPTEQRPPQYSGPSYAPRALAPDEPTTGEQVSNVAAGAGRGLMEGISDAASVADRALMGPTVTAPTWKDPLAPVREVGQHIAEHPTSVLPLGIYSEVQQAATDPIGRRAVEAAGGGTEPLFRATVPESVPYVGGTEIAPSAQDVGGFASSAVLDPLNYIGAAGAGLAGKGVRAVAAEGLRGVPLVGESEALLRGGAGLVRRGAVAVSDALAGNAERMAAADARMAQEGSTAAPGVFGLSGLEPNRPEVQGMRPRIIPPDVADQLDIPLRLPEDPAIIRAIEAAGGTVDERGTTLHVIRNQGPEAAGGTATRGMTYHIAGEPGAPNPFASEGGDIGGTVRVEGPTRFRNPLFISQESGGKGFLDDALEQLGVQSAPTAAQAQRLQILREAVAENSAAGPMRAALARDQAEGLRQLEAEVTGPVKGRREIDEQVNRIQDTTPQGSPERVAALQELVERYGGDPSVIPELVGLRKSRTESGYAIVENVIAAAARRNQHDGVIYLGKGIASASDVSAHPLVVAADDALHRANVAENTALGEADRLRAAGRRQGDPEYDAAWQRYQRASQRTREVLNQQYAAERAARAELTPRTIEELADPRELRNPTPGAPNARIPEQEAATSAALDRLLALRNEFWRAGGTDGAWNPHEVWPEDVARLSPELQRIHAEWSAAQQAYEDTDAALKGLTQSPGPPGYTLRPDIPRRAAVRESTIEPNQRLLEAEQAYKAAQAREDQFYSQFLEAQDRDPLNYNTYDNWAERTGNREAAQAKADLQQTMIEWRRVENAGEPRYTTAQASAGALPAASETAYGSMGALPPSGRGRRWHHDASYPDGGYWYTPAARRPADLVSADRDAVLARADLRGAQAELRKAETLARLHPEDAEAQQRLMDAVSAEEQQAARTNAANEWLQMVTTGDRTLASGGALPAALRRGDPLAGVNRVLSQGLVSSASGGMSAAAADQLGDPDDPYRQAKAFAAGALIPPLGARAARGAARLAGAESRGARGALGTLGSLPEDAPPSTLGPVAQRVMDTYTALTPKRVEAVTAKGIDVATAAIEKRARPGAMPVPAAELVPQIHAAVVRNLDDTKVVMTGLNSGALRAFLRGEGLTSKAETGNLDLINQITTTQVNVAGGRQVLNEATGKMEKAPFTIKEGADFAQRESEQMRAVTGGSRFPDPETGAIDTEAPKVLYAYVSEGQPLVAPNRPTLGLVWKPETPRVSSVNHPFGLLSPNLDMHKAMAEGSQDLVYAADAVRGGRIAPATMEGGRLVEAGAGVPSSGKARFGWEQGGIDVGGGRKLADTDYLVGPEGESSLRATSLVSGMSKDIQQAIARGQMTDPEQIAAVLMRGGSPQWKPGWGSVMNPTRTESLVLDPHLANVQAIYISGTPSNLASMLEGAGKGKGAGERLAELEMARRMRAAIKAETGNDVPIIFNDTSRAAASKKQLAEGASNEGWAPTRLISDAQVLEGPPLTLSPGRGRIVDQYTQAIDPTTGEPYMNIGVTAGAVPPSGRSDPLASVNRVLGQGAISGVTGTTTGLVNQELNPDDPNAFGKGFVAGAAGPVLAQRGARGLARLAGARGAEEVGGALATFGTPGAGGAPQPGPGFFARFPGAQKAVAASQQRAASMQARGLTPPSAWDWIKQAGYSGIFGPATLVGNVTAGVVDTGLAQVKEATRALTMRQGGRYGAQAKAQLQAVPEALEGLKAIAFGQGGSAGAAARSGGSQGTANLSERVVNPVAHVAARLMEKPGELLAEAPDAVFRPIFNAQGMQREADRIAHELGHRGQLAAQTAEQMMQDAQAARANPNQLLVSAEARRIVDAGKAYADEMGYKGDPGGLATWIGDLSKRDDAAGVAASFLFPFSKTPGNIAIAAARSTPGIGLLPGVRQGRPIKSFDVIYDQAFGTLAASGLAAYAASGGITGSGPATKPERDAMVAQGWQPRSTLVAGHYIPNRAFGKLQPMLDAIGESHDALAYRKPDQSASAFATDAVKRLGKIATDQVGLSGLADVFDLIDGFGAQAPGLVGRSITRYTPFGGVIRAAAQAIDPNARKPESWDQAGFGGAVAQQVEQSIPMLRSAVPAAQDILGRPMPNPQQGLGALVPKTTTLRDDRLLKTYQEAGVGIGGPPDAIGDVTLTPAQQRRWNTARGQALQAARAEVLGARTLPKAEREAELRRILRDAATEARDTIEPTFTERQRAEAERKAS